MIRVETYKKKSKYIGFKVEGHANFSTHGSDIVCAGVSVLVQTCVNSIEQILKVAFDFKENQEKGLVKLKIKDDNSSKIDEVSLLIESMELGIRAISELYPKYVAVNSREV